MSDYLYILDSDIEPLSVPNNAIIVLWSQYPQSTNVQQISIPALVQQQDDVLKKRLLAWLYELGEVNIANKRIVDHLVMRPGLSYWWMTTLTGKHFALSNAFYNTLRLFVLEQIVFDAAPTKIIFYSDNKPVSQVIRALSQRLNIQFQWVKNVRKACVARSWYQKLYHWLPYPLQSIIVGISYIWLRRGSKPEKQNQPVGDITFVDYFAHLGPQVQETGIFSSNYWTSLIDLLRQHAIKTNWLHYYVTNGPLASIKKSQELICRFNISGAGLEHHQLIDAALDIRIIGQVLLDYCKLAYQSIRLKKIAQFFIPAESNLDLWPLFKREWQRSLRGPSVVLNCFMLNLLEINMKRLPKQKLGFYLQENLSWEMALIYAWKKYNHGQLIGVAHASIRYWDLRYFYDPRSYIRGALNSLPLPDKVAVNGDLSWSMHQKSGYPEQSLIKIEALRFLYLSHLSLGQKNRKDYDQDSKKILICGDFIEKLSLQMLDWLSQIVHDLPCSFEYFYRPHPLSPIAIEKYSFLQKAKDAFTEALQAADIVFTSNVTCAAIDAYCAGIPVVQLLDGDSLNLSPLYRLPSVYYATSPDVLKNILNTDMHAYDTNINDIFYTDLSLLSWKKVLGI